MVGKTRMIDNTEAIRQALKPDFVTAGPNECFEYRAKQFEIKYGFLAPGKDSREERPPEIFDLWKDFGIYVPCICGKRIPV